MHRAPSIQTVSWFVTLFRNGQLNLSPPYQRNSFWNQEYKNFFIDSILNSLPTSAVFLFQEIDDQGNSRYHVVDGKQRLGTILEFVENEFPVPESVTNLAGKYFKDLDPDDKRRIWNYQLSVETVPDTNETLLTEVFDRINRNVAKLKPQELRHARFDGAFISLCEQLAATLVTGFPNISQTDKTRMRDVEYVSTLLIFLVKGPESLSQADIDRYYSDWDQSLPADTNLLDEYTKTHSTIKQLLADPSSGQQLLKSRLKNLADYYSLFGATAEEQRDNNPITIEKAASRLVAFAERVEAVRADPKHEDEVAKTYYEAARSASNDPGPRRRRIDILKKVMRGDA